MDSVFTEADVSLQPVNIKAVKVSVCFNLLLHRTAPSIQRSSSCGIITVRQKNGEYTECSVIRTSLNECGENISVSDQMSLSVVAVVVEKDTFNVDV